MKTNALTIKKYCRGYNNWTAYKADEKTTKLIVRLAEILDQLEPQGDDNLHSIWLKAPRPSFRQFYRENYEFDYPYRNADTKTLENAREEYQVSYPDTNVWFELADKHFTQNTGEEFYAVFVDHCYVFAVNDPNSKYLMDGSELLEWAIAGAEKTIELVKSGTYEKEVLRRIPYRYLSGRIKRCDLWEADPTTKTQFFFAYKKREIRRFCATFQPEKLNKPVRPQMTARTYYEACSVIYGALGITRESVSYRYTDSDEEHKQYHEAVLTPKELFYAVADGRDDGLKNVPMDDPAAFEEWAHHSGPFYEFSGGHPWEIIPSFSISLSLHLYPVKHEAGGYYFLISGASERRAPDTIIAANALDKAGYPLQISKHKEILDRFSGNDYISIVPERESTYIDATINLPKGKAGKAVAAKAEWQYKEYKLKTEPHGPR